MEAAGPPTLGHPQPARRNSRQHPLNTVFESKMESPISSLDRSTRAKIIRPPDHSTALNIPTVFLAGPTTSRSSPDWRTRLSTSIADLPVTILNPKNLAWDSTWKEDRSDPRWVAQVEWEMSMREASDVAVFFFEGGTDAPITMLELGLSLATASARQRILVFAAKDFSKRGNVHFACGRYKVEVEEDEATMVESLRSTLLEMNKVTT